MVDLQLVVFAETNLLETTLEFRVAMPVRASLEGAYVPTVSTPAEATETAQSRRTLVVDASIVDCKNVLWSG